MSGSDSESGSGGPNRELTEDSTCSSSVTTNKSSSESSVSLLDRLRSPEPSVLSRKRKLRQNLPPSGRKRGKGRVFANPKSITPAERVRSYPNEHFSVNANKKLFCLACREEVATKKSIIDLHVKSQKHERGKQRLAQKTARELTIMEALKKFDSEHHPVGETLPDSTRVYRVKVVTAMLKAGISLNKIDSFRDLLEDHGYSLTSSSNLRQLLPFILQEEMTRLKMEIDGEPVSIVFDGTTHVCEAMVVVLRFICSDWVVKQKVCRLLLLAKSMSGEEIARQVITVLSTELGIPSHLLLAAMRDRAAVNGVAMRTVSIIYNQVMDIGCFSHTLDLVGEHMKVPVLDSFVKPWIAMFARSPKCRLLWHTQTGLSPPSYSSTRWWSRFEVIQQLLSAFGDVTTFLSGSDLPPATSSQLLAILQDPVRCRKLKIELAITVDAMQPFVQATYSLEGDGPLALVAYEQISMLYSVISTEHFPNVNAVARELSGVDQGRERQLIAYTKAVVLPAFTYFQEKFDRDLKPTLLAFKAARFFSPAKVCEMKPTASDLNSLCKFPFLSASVIDSLKSELPMYLAASEDVSSQTDVIEWWKLHEASLPNWAKACRMVLLVQPSSAAAERVFSILSNSFSTQQYSSLKDYIQLSVMLQYNYH